MQRLNEYQEFVKSKLQGNLPQKEEAARSAMGLAKDAGAAIGCAKSALYCKPDEAEQHTAELKSKLGSTLFWVSALAAQFGLEMQDIMDSNVSRVQGLFPPTQLKDKPKFALPKVVAREPGQGKYDFKIGNRVRDIDDDAEPVGIITSIDGDDVKVVLEESGKTRVFDIDGIEHA